MATGSSWRLHRPGSSRPRLRGSVPALERLYKHVEAPAVEGAQPMEPGESQTCRVVVQQIHADGKTWFRIVVYDDGRLRGMSEFETALELQMALQTAIADFRLSSFLEQLNNPQTHIVLDMYVDLNEAQRSLLRLLPSSQLHRHADGSYL